MSITLRSTVEFKLTSTLKGYEGMYMIHEGQVNGTEKGDLMGQISFTNKVFGMAA